MRNRLIGFIQQHSRSSPPSARRLFATRPAIHRRLLLQEWCQDGTRTVYQDIHRLPAGHTLVYSDGELTRSSLHGFFCRRALRLKRQRNMFERFRELLEKAVRDRLPRQPTGIFLSGGLDSTSVAAVACKIAKQEQTSGPWRLHHRLSANVQRRRRFLGNRLWPRIRHGHRDSFRRFLSSLRRLGRFLAAYPGAVSRSFSSSKSNDSTGQVQSHARVVLSGYGGDDILTGQAWPYLTYLLRPAGFRDHLAELWGVHLKYGRIPPLRGGFRTGCGGGWAAPIR